MLVGLQKLTESVAWLKSNEVACILMKLLMLNVESEQDGKIKSADVDRKNGDKLST